MTNRFVVKSGMPKGETYHREVYQCDDLTEAQECQELLFETAANFPTWLHGPHIYPLDADEMPLHWDGFEFTQAPKWEWIDYSGKSQN